MKNRSITPSRVILEPYSSGWTTCTGVQATQKTMRAAGDRFCVLFLQYQIRSVLFLFAAIPKERHGSVSRRFPFQSGGSPARWLQTGKYYTKQSKHWSASHSPDPEWFCESGSNTAYSSCRGEADRKSRLRPEFRSLPQQTVASCNRNIYRAVCCTLELNIFICQTPWDIDCG